MYALFEICKCIQTINYTRYRYTRMPLFRYGTFTALPNNGLHYCLNRYKYRRGLLSNDANMFSNLGRLLIDIII